VKIGWIKERDKGERKKEKEGRKRTMKKGVQNRMLTSK
jgi:hypothetical protein